MPNYEIYQKAARGTQGDIIDDFTSFEAVLRNKSIGKWTLKSSGRALCPLDERSGIVVYRDGAMIFSGMVGQIEEEKDVATGVVSWAASGEEDSTLLRRRVIVPDPVGLDFAAHEHDVFAGPADDCVLTFAARHIAQKARSERRIANLFTAEKAGVFPETRRKERFSELYKTVSEVGDAFGFVVMVDWDNSVGSSVIRVTTPTDKSETVIFSPEFGNLSRWKRKRIAPKANAVWCGGQGVGTSRMFVYVEDAASILKWGRIEAFKDRRDVSDEQDPSDPRSPEEVLTDEAMRFLEESKETDGFEVEIIPIETMQYRRDWNLGDIVSVAIEGIRYVAPIEEVKIKYSNLVETITPTIGQIDRGVFEKTKVIIDNLSDRVTVLERKE